MPWEVVSKSVIGSKHIQMNKPCQDYSEHKIIGDRNEIILGAVSDGMGSAKSSEIGSKLAVETTLKYLENKDIWQNTVDEGIYKECFHNLLIEVRNTLDDYAKNHELNIHDLACTLIAFVATPELLVAIQVGDGLIVVRRSDQENYELLFEPDKGEYANETTSVTSSTAVYEMRGYIKPETYSFICAATDGIENISLLKRESSKPYDEFFKVLEEFIFSSKIEHKEKEVEDFLNQEKINKRTDDDKTLLLCAYSHDDIKVLLSKPIPTQNESDDIQTSFQITENYHGLDDIKASLNPHEIDEQIEQVNPEIGKISEAKDQTE